MDQLNFIYWNIEYCIHSFLITEGIKILIDFSFDKKKNKKKNSFVYEKRIHEHLISKTCRNSLYVLESTVSLLNSAVDLVAS